MSRYLFTSHVVFLIIYSNLAVRDILPFGVRTNMESLGMYKDNIVSIWCMINVMNFHHFGYAILTALLAIGGQMAVNEAPAMTGDVDVGRQMIRMTQLTIAICIGQYVQQLDRSRHAIKNTIIKRQQQQLKTIFMRQ